MSMSLGSALFAFSAWFLAEADGAEGMVGRAAALAMVGMFRERLGGVTGALSKGLDVGLTMYGSLSGYA